ncbi:Rtt106-domain-containing protein [Ophiobolus disseminans]|uniref:Rtt106-domain-containing protein n=1 Tax=Ophiobolus disseminans TaxID=1469910 RepID=A0A6A7AKE6_9PLEO|nr:Rtt106-domain-containing protein [Ophiobolus disseminans]
MNSQVRVPQPPPVPAAVVNPTVVTPAGPHPKEIDEAFASNHELRKRVHAAIDDHPTQTSLFRDISTFILNQASQPSAEPAAKKRKLEDSNGAQDGAAPGGSLANAATKAWRTYPGVSFSLPQRKKFTLELVDKKDGGIRAIGAGGSVEFSIAWRDVDQVFCLPVPEKAKKQHNFIIIPTHGDGVNPLPEHLKGSPPEPIVWTFEEATGKNIVEGEDPGPGPMAEAIHHCLIQAGTGKEVVFPDADEFASAVPESHRKSEKAYHVKAHRGSKEGYLFFTSVGILYGFKKPLAYFDFASINSIAYAAVLRNTFNLAITTQTQEIEFGMLEQADYAGINDYVQKHGLQDASLAAARRAKKLNVNKGKGKESGANGAAAAEADDGEEEEGELQKAERELQDQEDEEEEDYDPGSEGESEGSGSESGDDDGGGGYDEGEGEEDDGDEMEE